MKILNFDRYLPHAKKAIQLAIPIVIAQAGMQLTHVVDNMMVGQVSSLHLAAAALANYIYLVPMLFGVGFVLAITPLSGNAYGSDNLDECKNLFSNSFYSLFIFSILLTTLIYFLGYFIPIIDPDSTKTALSQSYYNYLAISTFFIMGMGIFRSYFDSFGFTIYGMIAMILGNIVNVFFNWVFIYGNLGFPAMELDGAGLGTLISRICAFIFIILIGIFNKKLKPFLEFPRLKRISKAKIKEIFKIGFNIGVQSSVEISSFTLVIIFAGWLGTTDIAAYQIAISITGIAYLSAIGIASASTILISKYNGEKNVGNIIDGSFSATMLTSLFMGICSIILILTRSILPPLFVNEAEVIEIAATLIFVMALVQIPDGLSVTFMGILRGLLDTKVPMFITAAVFWGFMVPLSYLLAFVFDFRIYGIIAAVASSIVIGSLIMYFRYRFTLKKQIQNLRKGGG
jgi:MATE family multidrug resistance protein